jgi:hypothetical protein
MLVPLLPSRVLATCAKEITLNVERKVTVIIADAIDNVTTTCLSVRVDMEVVYSWWHQVLLLLRRRLLLFPHDALVGRRDLGREGGVVEHLRRSVLVLRRGAAAVVVGDGA